MEPQGGRGISPFRVTKRSTKLRRLSKTTRRSRVHVQTVGLNAETVLARHTIVCFHPHNHFFENVHIPAFFEAKRRTLVDSLTTRPRSGTCDSPASICKTTWRPSQAEYVFHISDMILVCVNRRAS